MNSIGNGNSNSNHNSNSYGNGNTAEVMIIVTAMAIVIAIVTATALYTQIYRDNKKRLGPQPPPPPRQGGEPVFPLRQPVMQDHREICGVVRGILVVLHFTVRFFINFPSAMHFPYHELFAHVLLFAVVLPETWVHTCKIGLIITARTMMASRAQEEIRRPRGTRGSQACCGGAWRPRGP